MNHTIYKVKPICFFGNSVIIFNDGNITVAIEFWKWYIESYSAFINLLSLLVSLYNRNSNKMYSWILVLSFKYFQYFARKIKRNERILIYRRYDYTLLEFIFTCAFTWLLKRHSTSLNAVFQHIIDITTVIILTLDQRLICTFNNLQ